MLKLVLNSYFFFCLNIKDQLLFLGLKYALTSCTNISNFYIHLALDVVKIYMLKKLSCKIRTGLCLLRQL